MTEEKEPNGPGRVEFLDGRGDLPMIQVKTPFSSAEIYLQGAHVTHFKKKGEPPLLFLSQCSRFAEGQPIRGGIPIVFPWFGLKEGLGQHGFARIKTWELKESVPSPDGSVTVRFELPDCAERSSLVPFTAQHIVTVGNSLKLEFVVTNNSKSQEFVFENCLHSYFEIGDIAMVSIRGLEGVKYLDKVGNFAEKIEENDAIQIKSEVDRVYLDTTATVEILDRKLGRKTSVKKHASLSTVLWNPWIRKSQELSDFGNDDYQRMVCVESGNIAANQIRLPPGESSKLTVELSSEKCS